jgi:hypothetical protein
VVHWVQNYLAEPAGTPIYNFQGRWLLILAWGDGGRREGMSHRGDLPWRSLVEELRRSLVSYYG